MPTTTNTTQTFSYTCPDEPLSTSVADNTTVNATYTGPDQVWVMVDTDTGAWNMSNGYWTEGEDGADIAAPEGMTKVRLNAADHAFWMSILVPDSCTLTTTVSQVDETINLADGTTATYSYNYPMEPDEFVDFETVVINTADTTMTFDYLESALTWDEVRTLRNNMLTGSDGRVADDMPDSVKQPWIDYRAKLRDLPTNWAGVDPHKIIWPVGPDEA